MQRPDPSVGRCRRSRRPLGLGQRGLARIADCAPQRGGRRGIDYSRCCIHSQHNSPSRQHRLGTPLAPLGPLRHRHLPQRHGPARDAELPAQHRHDRLDRLRHRCGAGARCDRCGKLPPRLRVRLRDRGRSRRDRGRVRLRAGRHPAQADRTRRRAGRVHRADRRDARIAAARRDPDRGRRGHARPTSARPAHAARSGRGEKRHGAQARRDSRQRGRPAPGGRQCRAREAAATQPRCGAGRWRGRSTLHPRAGRSARHGDQPARRAGDRRGRRRIARAPDAPGHADRGECADRPIDRRDPQRHAAAAHGAGRRDLRALSPRRGATPRPSSARM